MMQEDSVADFPAGRARTRPVVFQRSELVPILDIYGRMVAAGEWRDYAIAGGSDEAVFSVFRRASEGPLFRIVKRPAAAARQGAFSVIAMDGRILRRGHDLAAVLKVLERRLLRLAD